MVGCGFVFAGSRGCPMEGKVCDMLEELKDC